MDLSAEETECIADAFQYYDSVGDGKLSVAQLGTCLRSLGFSPTEAQIAAFATQWPQKDFRLTTAEFIPIYSALKKSDRPATHEQIIACLSNFDRDQEGFVLESDLRHILENLGEKMSNREVDEIFSQIDFENGRARIHDVADLIIGKE